MAIPLSDSGKSDGPTSDLKVGKKRRPSTPRRPST